MLRCNDALACQLNNFQKVNRNRLFVNQLIIDEV